jgi:peptidoglycan/xylan/chitin deacetylase (PgdA/CDA1 family)
MLAGIAKRIGLGVAIVVTSCSCNPPTRRGDEARPAPSPAPSATASVPSATASAAAEDSRATNRALLFEAARTVSAGRDLTPHRWRDGLRVAVVLTFDLDAEFALLSIGSKVGTGMQSAAQTSAGAFGVRRGLSRITRLLQQHRVPATFAVPGAVAELHPDAVRALIAAGHEIACHGDVHEDLLSLRSRAEEAAVLDRALAVLRKLGAAPRGFRAPFSRLSPHTLELIAERGLLWDSTLSADDFHPYAIVLAGRETNLVEIPFAAHLNDWAMFGAPQATVVPADPETVLRIWKSEFDAARAEGGVFCLTLHPQVIGRAYRSAMLERLILHMQSFGDVWFARAADVAAYVRDQGAP